MIVLRRSGAVSLRLCVSRTCRPQRTAVRTMLRLHRVPPRQRIDPRSAAIHRINARDGGNDGSRERQRFLGKGGKVRRGGVECQRAELAKNAKTAFTAEALGHGDAASSRLRGECRLSVL